MPKTTHSNTRLLGRIAGLLGAAALLAGAAQADGTDAGTSVENTFTLDYDVSGTAQDTITNDTSLAGPGVVVQGTETTFTVDRVVDLTVTQTNSPLTSTPGSTAVLTFDVLNAGNDNQSFSFNIDDVAGDDFDIGTYTVTYAVDLNGDLDTLDPGETGTLVMTPTATGTTANITSDIPPDVTVAISISGDIPGAQPDADEDDLILVAQARDPVTWITEGASGSVGTITAADGDATNAANGVAENVLADVSGTTSEGATDGMHSDQGTYVVASPDLSASKTITTILTTPVDCSTDVAGGAGEYNAPDACIEYEIEVINNGATATATNIDIGDILPAEVDFVSATHSGWDAAPVPTLTVPSGAAMICDGTGATCDVSLTTASLAAGNTGTLTIRATIK
ncbi:MAG: hypothetical protein V3V03_00860 [Hyphomonadaceae bacterium]